MVYRELVGLRLKLAAWVALYGGWALLFLFLNVWPNSMSYYSGYWGNLPVYDTLFNKWLESLARMTPILALLGGVNLVSEETNNGTLSFLLTQPFTRTRIYTTKILLNAGALVGVISVTSLVIFVIDRLPRSVIELPYGLPSCTPDTYCSIVSSSHHMEFLPAVMGLVLILLVGAGVVTGAGFFSIYCHNTIQTIAAAIPLVFLTYLLLGRGGYRQQYPVNPGEGILVATGPLFSSGDILANTQTLLSWLAVLVVANIGLFILGLATFKRKSF